MRLVGLALLALAGCSASPAREVAPNMHPTIVSLNPCTDAILAEVADPAQLLAISSYSHDPAASSLGLAAAKRWPATRGTVEEVFALHPDLVVDGTYTSPATRDAFALLGLRLEQVGIAPTVEASVGQVRQLAALAGHPERGEALARRIEAAVAAAEVKGAPVPAIIWQSGGIVAGQGTLIDDLLRRTGFSNAAAARGLQQATYLPLEQVLASPPRVIFAAGNGASNEDRLLRHPALAGLRGTKREQLEPSLLWCGGPTIIRAAARLGEVRASLAMARTSPQPPPLERRGSPALRSKAPSSSEEGVGGGGVRAL
jgi:iron complex transport system substrate-binding protein